MTRPLLSLVLLALACTETVPAKGVHCYVCEQ